MFVAKNLFTPGPLTTSDSVKKAMLIDLGSRDSSFIELVASIRNQLLSLAGTKKGAYEAVLMQGSGTFSLEAVISSGLSSNGEVLCLVNGAYGKRVSEMAKVLGIPHQILAYPENKSIPAEDVQKALKKNPAIEMVSVAHCETTTGIMNPIETIGEVCKGFPKVNYFVDAMSTFGAVPINVEEIGIDYLVSSANKCIQGVPGFAFVIAKTAVLEKTKGYARSLSFDLFSQWKGLENNGQFRYTPPTHTLLAFAKALEELEQEGGVIGRAYRYKKNNSILLNGMVAKGYKPFIDAENRGYIITSFLYPENNDFNFTHFYEDLANKGHIIYPGKLTHTNCFRIGNIGHLFETDIAALLQDIPNT